MRKDRRRGRQREPPAQTEWCDLVRPEAVQDFASWLAAPEQDWELDAPEEGELLRAHKDGRCIAVTWDERRGVTVCQRTVMALWYGFRLSEM